MHVKYSIANKMHKQIESTLNVAKQIRRELKVSRRRATCEQRIFCGETFIKYKKFEI